MYSWVTWCKSQVCHALCHISSQALARSGDTAVLPAMKAWCTPYTLSVAGNESCLKWSFPFKRKVRELTYINMCEYMYKIFIKHIWLYTSPFYYNLAKKMTISRVMCLESPKNPYAFPGPSRMFEISSRDARWTTQPGRDLCSPKIFEKNSSGLTGFIIETILVALSDLPLPADFSFFQFNISVIIMWMWIIGGLMLRVHVYRVS